MKRMFFAALTVFLLLILFALYVSLDPDAAKRPANPESQTPEFSVAMVLPGSIDDHSWNRAGYEGLKLLESDFGARIAWQDNTTSHSSVPFFNKFAREGFDLIIGHGDEYGDVLPEIADRYPRPDFMVVGFHPGNNRNLGSAFFRELEGFFLAGALAGIATQTNRVALVCGMIYPNEQELMNLYCLGAQWANPKVQCEIRGLGSWDAPDKAREVGRELIDGGFDVIGINADAAGYEIQKLAAEARIKCICWFLYDEPLSSEVIGRLDMPLDRLIHECARLSRLGRWEGKQYKFGLQQNLLKLVPNPESLDSPMLERFNALQQDLKSGTIKLSMKYGIQVRDNNKTRP